MEVDAPEKHGVKSLNLQKISQHDSGFLATPLRFKVTKVRRSWRIHTFETADGISLYRGRLSNTKKVDKLDGAYTYRGGGYCR